ncbi:hypothetical protein PanWU01x14_185890 [Parasponia andersonii]|uniref:Uncharacterized protein n=1 Tax=Parasponia andersonii TaxID=3476 RepID=A0A2P5C3W4_PARAD|nr:hypothetical protein PanWU01x14_185890 [Parasponia andersonii]
MNVVCNYFCSRPSHVHFLAPLIRFSHSCECSCCLFWNQLFPHSSSSKMVAANVPFSMTKRLTSWGHYGGT